MSIKQNKISKFIKTFIALVIILASSLSLAKTVKANWEVEAWMIRKTPLGIMPLEVDGSFYFCADRGLILRTGRFDPKIYFPDNSDHGIKKIETLKGEMRGLADSRANKVAKGYYKGYAVYNSEDDYITGGLLDPTQFIVGYTKEGLETNGALWRKIKEDAQSVAYNIINRRFAALSDIEKPVPYSPDIDPEELIEDGPKVGVMEGEDGERGYTVKGPYTTTNSENSYILSANHFNKNNTERSWGYDEIDMQVAYWMQNDRKGRLQGPDNLEISEEAMTNGKKLYGEALAYAKFVKDGQASNYQTSIDTSNTQVFVNRRDGARNEDEYIIGPISISYPSAKTYEDPNYPLPETPHFSYMTDIILKTDTGATLNYTKGDFKLIKGSDISTNTSTYPGGSFYPTTGKGGYPENNETFYIIVNASKANYPKKLNISADFEYVKNSEAVYMELKAKGVVYQYQGYLYYDNQAFSLDYPGSMWGSIQYHYTIYYKQFHKEPRTGYWTDSEGNLHSYTYYVDVENSYYSSFPLDFYEHAFAVQPIVGMYEKDLQTRAKIAEYEGQPLIKLLANNIELGTASASIDIDLTMEMGGTVWVDEKNGKESALNGQYDVDELGNPLTKNGNGEAITNPDKPMSGVTVKLHQLDHTGKESVVGTTKTDEKGAYLFKELNAQYQYYVEFVYNGQYYEPTKHKVSKQNGESTTTAESRGLDFLSDKKNIRSTYYNYPVDIEGRDTFNARFEEISSTPNNYESKDGREYDVYTRDYLQKNGYIDEFGNPTETAPQYVKDCLMSTFTMDDKYEDKLNGYDSQNKELGNTSKVEEQRNIEYYPRYSKFIVDEGINAANKGSLASDSQSVAISTYTPVYSGVYNIKKINQGYNIRQLADIALSKDVYKVVQEINGKSETYKYNKREAAQDEDKCWTVETRTENQYYKKGYTREIYREDWIYQAEDTAIKELGTTLKNPKTELEVFVTYRVRIRNLSESLGVRITELVDYYDADYTPVLERSFVGDRKEEKLQDITIKSENDYNPETHVTSVNQTGSIYSNTENSKNAPSGFKKLYVTGFDNILLDSDDSNETYIYLTFRVNKNKAKEGYEYVILDQSIVTKTEYDRGKDNVVEINGYKTYYGTHTKYDKEEDYGKAAVSPNGEYKYGNIAGIVDRNSKPGNVLMKDEVGIGLESNGTIVEENFENDTDNAPSIKILILDETTVRSMDGVVWEDNRTETVENSKTGNGTRESGEQGVNNVIVQLVEKIDKNSIREELRSQFGDDLEYVWKEMSSGDRSSQGSVINVTMEGKQLIDNFAISNDGEYMFKGYIPGKYYIRFIYGTDDKTTGTDENYKKYNGQDYKSTLYHSEYDNGATFDVNNPDINTAFLSLEDLNNNVNNNVTYSYARDTMRINTPANYANDLLRRDVQSIEGASKEYYKTKYLEGTNTLSYPNDAKSYNGGTLIAGTREYVNTYKKGNEEMKNELAQELSNTTPNTFIIAKTALINTEGEYNRQESTMGDEILVDLSGQMAGKNTANNNTTTSGYYHISDLSFGLQERPKAQLKATKQVRHVEVKLSNQSILFDAKGRATNVLWIDHDAHGQDIKNTYKVDDNYEEQFGNNGTMFMKEPIVRKEMGASANNGLIDLTMDEEQMHGAQLKITYLITIANIGEVDYKDNQYYYKGIEGDAPTNIVKTRPMQIIDYVGYQTVDDDKTTRNNLRYIASDNDGWTVKTAEELYTTDKLLSEEAYKGTSANGNKGANQYTTIVTTEFNNELVPVLVDGDYASSLGNNHKATEIKDKAKDLFKTDDDITCASVVAKTLVLTQTLSADDGGDDKTYNNLMEIVKVNNTVGRRMRYSVVGNQNPTEEPTEIDADNSQQIRILPPFGQNYIYYILGGAIAIILIAGIAITIRVTRKK